MKKVVIVAYGFPPVGGAGVQRPLKFVKYLRDFGWEPVVLTVSNPSVPVVDESLMRDIPAGVAIYGARTLEPSYAKKQSFSPNRPPGRASFRGVIKAAVTGLLLPDLQVLWWPSLVVRLIQVIRKERPGCLYVTAPPFSSFLPVVTIGRLWRVPVVIDFRDEWAFSRSTWEHAAKHLLAKTLDRVFERYAVRSCSALVAANRSYVESIGKSHGCRASEKGVVITNGYDESDFADTSADEAKEAAGGAVKITYAGTVWNAASLKPFLGALKRVIIEDPTLVSRTSVKVFGRIVGNEMDHFEDGDIQKVTTLFGYCDHSVVAREIAASDILLITLSDLPGAQKIIAGKAFEYMATGKHIFAIIPKGETEDIVGKAYGNSTVVAPDDAEGIYRALRLLLINIDCIRQQKGNDISHYSRKHLTGKLAQLFERITGSPASL